MSLGYDISFVSTPIDPALSLSGHRQKPTSSSLDNLLFNVVIAHTIRREKGVRDRFVVIHIHQSTFRFWRFSVSQHQASCATASSASIGVSNIWQFGAGKYKLVYRRSYDYLKIMDLRYSTILVVLISSTLSHEIAKPVGWVTIAYCFWILKFY